MNVQNEEMSQPEKPGEVKRSSRFVKIKWKQEPQIYEKSIAEEREYKSWLGRQIDL